MFYYFFSVLLINLQMKQSEIFRIHEFKIISINHFSQIGKCFIIKNQDRDIIHLPIMITHNLQILTNLHIITCLKL
ncbi:hypothetical protein pb186bvf_000301 [Paramecium bursaria]